jgi:hypothetical protein
MYWLYSLLQQYSPLPPETCSFISFACKVSYICSNIYFQCRTKSNSLLLKTCFHECFYNVFIKSAVVIFGNTPLTSSWKHRKLKSFTLIKYWKTSVRNTVFLVLDFILHLSHYMFRPHLAAIFRWFTNTKIYSRCLWPTWRWPPNGAETCSVISAQ